MTPPVTSTPVCAYAVLHARCVAGVFPDFSVCGPAWQDAHLHMVTSSWQHTDISYADGAHTAAALMHVWCARAHVRHAMDVVPGDPDPCTGNPRSHAVNSLLSPPGQAFGPGPAALHACGTASTSMIQHGQRSLQLNGHMAAVHCKASAPTQSTPCKKHPILSYPTLP